MSICNILSVCELIYMELNVFQKVRYIFCYLRALTTISGRSTSLLSCDWLKF